MHLKVEKRMRYLKEVEEVEEEEDELSSEGDGDQSDVDDWCTEVVPKVAGKSIFEQIREELGIFEDEHYVLQAVS